MAIKDKAVFIYSNDWNGTPIKFNWSGATFFTVKEAKEMRKSLKKAIKVAKEIKKQNEQ